MSTIDHIQASYHSEVPSAKGLRVGIAVAEWNNNITSPLLEGALGVLKAQQADEVTIFRVPGTFELVNASARLIDMGLDAVIAIGCVVRGDTPHFDYICQGVTAGLSALYIGAFGASHPLAKKIGAWPSVLTVTALTSGAAHLLSDRK